MASENSSSSSSPRDVKSGLARILKRKADVANELSDVEPKIYVNEGEYSGESSKPHGTFIQGWDRYFSPKKNTKEEDTKKKREVREEDHLLTFLGASAGSNEGTKDDAKECVASDSEGVESDSEGEESDTESAESDTEGVEGNSEGVESDSDCVESDSECVESDWEDLESDSEEGTKQGGKVGPKVGELDETQATNQGVGQGAKKRPKRGGAKRGPNDDVTLE